MSGAASKVRDRWVKAWPLALGAIFAALSTHRLHDADLYWHLALGRAVVESHTRNVPEPFALGDYPATCLTPQWLWDVLLHALHGAWGFLGIAWLVVLVAALAGAALSMLATRWDPERRPSLGVLVAVTLLAAPLVLTRLNERAEAATMVLWPIGLLLARRVSRATSLREATSRGAALVALSVVWAQIHLTILPFAVAVAVVLAPSALGKTTLHRARAATLGFVVLCTILTAHGLDVLSPRTVDPVGFYIRDHIAEWMPVRWDMLDPSDSENVQVPAYVALVVTALLAGFRWRRQLMTEFALTLLGVLIASRGRRGLTPAALLAVPLAVTALDAWLGASAEKWARLTRALAATAGVLTLVRTAGWVEAHQGRLGRLGLEASAFPLGAVQLLGGDPAEHRALTTYRSGPPLGYETHGRVRTFVDSRTPLNFSEADLAAARTTWAEPRALPLAVARWGFDVAVVERSMPVCDALRAARDWAVVLVEPGFTTFKRSPGPGDTPIRHVVPCGTSYLDDASCAAGGAPLDADIERLAAFTSRSFADYLRGERILRCATTSFDGTKVASLLSNEGGADGFETARDAAYAWLMALAGRREEAIALLTPHVESGKPWVVRDALPALAKGGADASLRTLLLRMVHDEPVPDAIIVTLANVCARAGDAACARVNASRASATGRLDVAPALCWLRTVGRPDQRADAEKWLQTLRAAAPAGLATLADCGP